MIQLADARRIIAAAEKKAEEIGQPMNVAVVDEGGNLIAFERMANAWLGSIDIAQKKAWTSRAFDITTKDLGANSQSGDQFFGIHASNNGKVMIFAGGIPSRKMARVVGAIGSQRRLRRTGSRRSRSRRSGPLNHCKHRQFTGAHTRSRFIVRNVPPERVVKGS